MTRPVGPKRVAGYESLLLPAILLSLNRDVSVPVEWLVASFPAPGMGSAKGPISQPSAAQVAV